ncbi:hypothetical protein MferCBS31731_002095 [Microsporum ferrugineum]
MARFRLRSLQKILDGNPTGETELSGIDRSTLYTFESLYGTVYLPLLPGGMLNRIIDTIPNHPLDIWCDDSFYSTKIPPNIRLPKPKEGRTLFWDTRSADDGGQILTSMEGTCANGKLYAFNIVNPKAKRETIVICPSPLSQYSSLGQFQVNMLSAPEKFAKGVHIDKFRFSLVFTLIHELSHSILILRDLATSDVKGQVDSYGWKEATFHGDTNHLNAQDNADNFAFFVLGNIDLLSTPVLLALYADCPGQSDVPK